MSYSKEVIKKSLRKGLCTEMWAGLGEPARNGAAPRN